MKAKLLRHKPLFLFWAIYTLVFLIAVRLAVYLMPIAVALTIAVIMKPLYDLLRRRFFFKSAFTATVITLLVFGVLTAIAGFLLYLIARQAISLYESYGYLIEDYFSSPELFDHIREAVLSGNLIGTLSDVAASLFRIVPLMITFVIFTFVLTIYLINHMHRLKRSLLRRIPEKHRSTVGRVLSAAYLLVRRFIRSYLILYLITFVEAVFIFWLTGVEYPLAFAFITAVADVLPVLGPGVIYVPFGIVFILQQNYLGGVTLLVFFLLTSILRQILEPKIVSDSVKVHPLAVMAAIYFSIAAMNIWILFYVVLLFLVYKVLTLAGVLPDRRSDDADHGDELSAADSSGASDEKISKTAPDGGENSGKY